MEVSFDWIKTTAYLSLFNASWANSGVIGLPHSTPSFTATFPFETPILYQRSPNAPIEKNRAFSSFLTKFLTQASISPVALDVEIKQLLEVNKSFLSPSSTS
ncbi:hypothetical protein ES703_33426 [subsurface metagenome]